MQEFPKEVTLITTALFILSYRGNKRQGNKTITRILIKNSFRLHSLTVSHIRYTIKLRSPRLIFVKDKSIRNWWKKKKNSLNWTIDVDHFACVSSYDFKGLNRPTCDMHNWGRTARLRNINRERSTLRSDATRSNFWLSSGTLASLRPHNWRRLPLRPTRQALRATPGLY